MRFSEVEIQQLAKAWIAISLAFAFVWRGAGDSLGLHFGFIYLTAALTVGVAFIIHELAHKYMAQKYGCWAEFRSYDLGLVLAIIMSLVGGIVFAAPGAVMIAGMVSAEENGKIAAAGPITNLILAAIFLVIGEVFGSLLFGVGTWLGFFVSFGYSINAWLALFNMIPFGPLDGAKVMNWSGGVWLALTGIAAVMTFLL